jgi:2-polyprenyl-3-methyl-5-hydroxy-6-metoxy-1,4-benzoquinol methylase
VQSGRLLDVGAGVGTQLHLMKEKGFDVVGTEISIEAIEKCKSLFNIELLEGYVEDLSFEDEQFDLITMWHVFEHLPYPGNTLEYLTKKLKKGGWIFIAVPNNSFHRLMAKPKYYFKPRKERLEALIGNVPYEKTFSEIHLIHFTPSSLINILEKKGYLIEELSLDNISLRPGLVKDMKYAVRNIIARKFHFYAHKALFICARKES